MFGIKWHALCQSECRIFFMYVIMSEMCCSSHLSWDFHWYKFKDIYWFFLEELFIPMRSSRRAVLILRRKQPQNSVCDRLWLNPCTKSELGRAVKGLSSPDSIYFTLKYVIQSYYILWAGITWYPSLILKGLSLPSFNKKKCARYFKLFVFPWCMELT